jgi:hypothetical protein
VLPPMPKVRAVVRHQEWLAEVTTKIENIRAERRGEGRSLRNGHLLRAAKQMGLRGNARNYDGQGRCTKQGLVFCDHDMLDLTAAAKVLFPKAPRLTIDNTWSSGRPHVERQETQQELLLQVLGRANRPAGTIPVDWVVAELYGALTSKTWRDVTKHVTMKDLENDLAALGLVYKGGKGRGARSYFEEIQDSPIASTAVAETDGDNGPEQVAPRYVRHAPRKRMQGRSPSARRHSHGNGRKSAHKAARSP